ncbi:hypothetical protein OU682_24095 [Paracoccus sp. EF6]|uniref:Uncharacterized protein n=1 Tax=Paracoccus benzoatiresistens TaxID=2997341 RepID=A0ABT4JBZ2_9RHOB|nr:hypothetical protein [Paracoccus sp. EF6]
MDITKDRLDKRNVAIRTGKEAFGSPKLSYCTDKCGQQKGNLREAGLCLVFKQRHIGSPAVKQLKPNRWCYSEFTTARTTNGAGLTWRTHSGAMYVTLLASVNIHASCAMSV